MKFFLRQIRDCDYPHGEWVLGFLDEQGRQIGSDLSYDSPEPLRVLFVRGAENRDAESRVAFEDSIQRGHGEVWLALMPEQYRKLSIRRKGR